MDDNASNAGNGADENEGQEIDPQDDPTGKPTIDEPTGPALEPGPDEFDKQAEDR